MIDLPAVVDVPLRTDEHGAIRVGGTRVLLEVVIGALSPPAIPSVSNGWSCAAP